MHIAYYKGKGGMFNKWIRLWLRSERTHEELIIDGVWYTASHLDGGVCKRKIEHNPNNWDVYKLDAIFDEEYAKKYFADRMRCKYDWVGIGLTQVVPLGIHLFNRYFCTEIVQGALQIEDSHRLNPKTSFKQLEPFLTKVDNYDGHKV